ncbi:MAG: YebC/PmpR family DNA-binding transcriptional regulator [Salinisphaeraceae bacterium]|nr:YebC/PmpR family DNA-binding transcriptional regulator [Salinisphaeraceae bacterium]
MAGHSKWANIQYRKGAQDKKRAKIFTRLIREITVAARMGGGDQDANPRLRLAIDKALSNNMPKDNIERAVKRGSGETDGENFEEIRYEGYGPNGVAIMVDTMTDNRNRTVGEVRHAFSKHGGNLGADGSVGYLFDRKGVFSFGPDVDDEAVLELALEAGAEDVAEYDDGSFDVLCAPDDYAAVKQALAAGEFEAAESDVTMRPATTVELSEEDAESCLKLLDALEDLDDVQNVYSNAEFPEALLAAG